jgi:hypothetical protein
VAASEAFQTNISAQAHHLPVRPTTGMSFAQAHNITQFQFL